MVATRVREQGLEHAQRLDDPFNFAYALSVAAHYTATAGDRESTRTHADRAIALATEHGFPVVVASAGVVRGWAVGDAAATRDTLAVYEALGQRVAASFFRALLAETLLDRGETDAALEVLRAALAFTEESGEGRHLPELHRLRGECLRTSDGAAAGAAFQEAIAIARRQQARLWELRAVLALARLWHAQRRSAEARLLLRRDVRRVHGRPSDPRAGRSS